MSIKNITRLFNVIDNSLFCITGKLDYDRLTDSLIKLADLIMSTEDTDESLWCIGEFGECCLDNLIVGAYWHYTEWHDGQWSKGYAALSALGQVYTPNYDTLDDDNPAYEQLESMAKRYYKEIN